MIILKRLFQTLIVLTIFIGFNQPIRAQQEAPHPKDAHFWTNKGDLCAVYGNDKAAIKYYKNALALEPSNSRALFNLAISYGELENYEQAIVFINKALAIDSQNGLYFYGRGRIYLIFGEIQKAIDDLKHAAVLGNRDAQNYVKNTLQIEWE